jgi:hypothetical protein
MGGIGVEVHLTAIAGIAITVAKPADEKARVKSVLTI